MKYVGWIKQKHTFALRFYNSNKRTLNHLFIQITLMNPWWYPRIEKWYGNGSWICGWLFFYFGNIIANGKGKVKNHEEI